MKIKELNPYIQYKDSANKNNNLNELNDNFVNEILNTEISKNGFQNFYEKEKIILQLVLKDKNTTHIFDKDGTYPYDYENSEFYYDPTGYFKGKPIGRQRGHKIKIYADCNNIFNCINYFENNVDFTKLFN